VSPVIPPPTTATSAVTSPPSMGNRGNEALVDQYGVVSSGVGMRFVCSSLQKRCPTSPPQQCQLAYRRRDVTWSTVVFPDEAHMDPKDWRFPMECPACHAATGSPFRAHTHTEDLVIELRCHTCRHEWEISAPAPSIFLKRKEDRRSDPVI
jgi:hypothetical protein